MANYTFGQDILTDVLFRASESTTLSGGTASDYLARAKEYINRAYYDFLTLYAWPFAKKSPPGIINTAAQQTGTASVTNGSASLTLDTSIASSMADRKIYFDSEGIIYRITAHTAGTTAITLDATFKEATKASEAFTIFQDEYDLADDCMVPLRMWFRSDPESIVDYETDAHMFMIDRSYMSATRPAKWAYIADNKIRFSSWMEDAETIEYDYIYHPSVLDFTGAGSGDTPIIPLQHRPILADWALYLLLDDKNDPRSEKVLRDLNGSIDRARKQYGRLMKPKFRPKRNARIAP